MAVRIYTLIRRLVLTTETAHEINLAGGEMLDWKYTGRVCLYILAIMTSLLLLPVLCRNTAHTPRKLSGKGGVLL